MRNGHTKPVLADELETAVNKVLREAEELCLLLRKRREEREASGATNAIDTVEMVG